MRADRTRDVEGRIRSMGRRGSGSGGQQSGLLGDESNYKRERDRDTKKGLERQGRTG